MSEDHSADETVGNGSFPSFYQGHQFYAKKIRTSHAIKSRYLKKNR